MNDSRSAFPNSRTITFHNRRRDELRLWLEPWAEEIAVPPGSCVDLVVEGDGETEAADAEAPFEVSEEYLAFFAPGGALVHVFIDGIEQDTGTTQIRPPHTPRGTRATMTALFGWLPEARLGGTPSPADLLAAAMADGELRLEQMAEEHRAALKAACADDRDIWQIYATSFEPEHFDAAFDLIRSRPNWRCFSIFLGERLVGMSCFIGIDPERGVLEIGNTYYIPEMRGTDLNPRVKRLMLDRAFGCGFRRVEFRVDARNERSQAAMAKIGGVREGVLRADRITWTGHVRDTVLFSILADEWRERGHAA